MNYKVNGFDIIIPVFNEGENIIKQIEYLKQSSVNINNIIICYDFEEDTSVKAIQNSQFSNDQNILLVKNTLNGPCEAIKAGIQNLKSNSVIILPADDFYNGKILDLMYRKFLDGYDIICPSRFIKGGIMKNCPLLKYLITIFVAHTLYYLAKIKTKDPTNGFKMFSKKVLDEIPITSKIGFAYGLELLVKANKTNYKITEVPCKWIERTDRKSTFKIFKWSIAYLKWYFLAFYFLFT